MRWTSPPPRGPWSRASPRRRSLRSPGPCRRGSLHGVRVVRDRTVDDLAELAALGPPEPLRLHDARRVAALGRARRAPRAPLRPRPASPPPSPPGSPAPPAPASCSRVGVADACREFVGHPVGEDAGVAVFARRDCSGRCCFRRMMHRRGCVQRDGAFASGRNEGHPCCRPSVSEWINLEIQPNLGLVVDHRVDLFFSIKLRGVVVRPDRRRARLIEPAWPLMQMCAVHLADGTVINTPRPGP